MLRYTYTCCLVILYCHIIRLHILRNSTKKRTGDPISSQDAKQLPPDCEATALHTLHLHWNGFCLSVIISYSHSLMYSNVVFYWLTASSKEPLTTPLDIDFVAGPSGGNFVTITSVSASVIRIFCVGRIQSGLCLVDMWQGKAERWHPSLMRKQACLSREIT